MSDVQLEQINLNLLLVLDRLLQTRSVTKTALELSVTPSAVSHNLRNLRELFDDPLLVRGRGGLTPTPRADALRGPLRLALRQVQDALDTGPYTPRTARRRFVVACPDFMGHLLVTRLHRLITEEWTGVDLDVLPSARSENTWRLETGELSVAIGGLLPDSPGLERTILYREQLSVVVRAGHPEVGDSIDLATYARLPHALIGLEDRYEPDDTVVDRALNAAGHRRRIAIRQRSFFGTLHLVLQSDLITMLPHTMAIWAARHFDVRILACPLPDISYTEEMVWHQRFDADVGHRWLRHHLTAAARDVRKELLAERSLAPQPSPPDPLPPER